MKFEAGEKVGMALESLTIAYHILSKSTKAEGSNLKVMLTGGSVICPKCGFSGRLQARKSHDSMGPALACPRCGFSMKVKEGLDVKITRVEWRGRRKLCRRGMRTSTLG